MLLEPGGQQIAHGAIRVRHSVEDAHPERIHGAPAPAPAPAAESPRVYQDLQPLAAETPAPVAAPPPAAAPAPAATHVAPKPDRHPPGGICGWLQQAAFEQW